MRVAGAICVLVFAAAGVVFSAVEARGCARLTGFDSGEGPVKWEVEVGFVSEIEMTKSGLGV